MLTQKLSNNNQILAAYKSNTSNVSGVVGNNNGIIMTSSTNNNINMNTSLNRNSSKDSNNSNSSSPRSSSSLNIKQERQEYFQYAQERQIKNQKIDNLADTGSINKNTQAKQANSSLQLKNTKHMMSSKSPPCANGNQTTSEHQTEEAVNYTENANNMSPDSNSDLMKSVPSRFNSIDNISKRLNTYCIQESTSSDSNTINMTKSSTNPQTTHPKTASKDNLSNSKENFARQLIYNRMIDNNNKKAYSNNSQMLSNTNTEHQPLNIKFESNMNQQVSKQAQIASSSPTVYMPPSTSNGLSEEIRQKLREKIFNKNKNNPLYKNNSNVYQQQTAHNFVGNGSNTTMMDDGAGLRRTNSEPIFKVKSALLNRLKQRNHPIFNTKRPCVTNQQQQQKKISPISQASNYGFDDVSSSLLANMAPLKFGKDGDEQNAIAVMVAAAILQQQQNHQHHQYDSFNAQCQHLGLSVPFLNAAVHSQSQPYLNSIHLQALAALENYAESAQYASVRDQYPSASLSLSALPNSRQRLQKAMQASSFIPRFGNIVHVEEESGNVLADELRNANRPDDDQMSSSSFDYDIQATKDNLIIDSTTRLKTKNSNPSDQHHHHNQPSNISLVKNISSYSEPFLFNSHDSRQTLVASKRLSEIAATTSHKQFINNKSGISTNVANDVLMDFERTTYRTGIVYDTRMLKHECTCKNSKNHIETPDRLKAIYQRLESRNLLDDCEIIKANRLASLDDISLCHNEFYTTIFGTSLDERAKLRPEYLQYYITNICLAECNGYALLSDQDNSWNEEHTAIACRVAIAGTYDLAELVLKGKLRNGFALVRPPGSHAEHDKPLGFCYFNNVAIVAKMLKKNLKVERILIVDWDVHHGNGTQQLTYDDPNIMFLSLHRHDKGKFFPGSGSYEECGQNNGLGYNVNIGWDSALEPPMGDAEYLAAFRSVVMPIAEAYQPQIVLVSCGFDGTDGHPKELGGYKLTPTCFAYMTKKLMSVADGKVVLVLEGGYDLPSLCDSSEACLNALMNKQLPSFPIETLDAIPNSSAIETLNNVIDIQKKYWPVIRDNKKSIKMSQNQFIRIDTSN